MTMWGRTIGRGHDRDLFRTCGRLTEAVDEVRLEAALLDQEQAALHAEVVDVMRLLIERAGEVSPCVDAVLLVAEASVRPLAG